MDTMFTCLKHNRLRELFCTTCKTFICAECITFHHTSEHKPRYLHISQYVPKEIYQKIDQLIIETSEHEEEIEEEAKLMQSELQTLSPRLEEVANMKLQQATTLQKLAKQMMACSKLKSSKTYSENAKAELEKEKMKLNKAVKERNIEEIMKLCDNIEKEAELTEKEITPTELIAPFSSLIEELKKENKMETVIKSSSEILTKSHMMRFVCYFSDWKCDRTFFSSKMFLSEDCLTFGNTASDGYPAIIGTVPAEAQMWAYEVIPFDLDCDGSEGFGLIERKKYISVYNSTPDTPEVYNQIIGFMYKKIANHMNVEYISDMIMGSKYYVRVNMCALEATITGPNLKLTATLKPGVHYVPVFSCGCSDNSLQIRPLSFFEENE